MQRLSAAIDAAADFKESDHAAVEYTETPKGVLCHDLNAGQRKLLRALLGTYFNRVPDGVSPLPSYGEAALDAVQFERNLLVQGQS